MSVDGLTSSVVCMKAQWRVGYQQPGDEQEWWEQPRGSCYCMFYQIIACPGKQVGDNSNQPLVNTQVVKTCVSPNVPAYSSNRRALSDTVGWAACLCLLLFAHTTQTGLVAESPTGGSASEESLPQRGVEPWWLLNPLFCRISLSVTTDAAVIWLRWEMQNAIQQRQQT